MQADLEAALPQLLEQARFGAAHAFAPASGFAVGAAVLADDGTVYPGCNVENASYGLTICAERNAVGRAVVEGHRRLRAVLVYTETAAPTYPCGACLQVLAEFGPDMDVVLATPDGKMTRTTLPALMPHPFRFDWSSS